MRRLLPRFVVMGASGVDCDRNGDIYREGEGHVLSISWLGFWIELGFYRWDGRTFDDPPPPPLTPAPPRTEPNP
jgi:hypothetical protein